ncbi:MAG TPA: hypothetical protein VN786_01715 [Acidimicrobiales bacterium]|nr:hypothetical protein [Acidimicrobiales bacterium]
MNEKLSGLHREPTRRPGRLAPGGLVLFGLALAACGSHEALPPVAHVARSTGTTIAAAATNAALVATRCLRQHGLPDLPGPVLATSGPSKGQMMLDKAGLLAYPSSVVSQATAACSAAMAQLPSGPNSVTSAQQLQDLLAFAHCVRNHGVPNFPDPNSQGGFSLAGTGINSHQLTSAELAAARTCLPTAHGQVHIPAQGSGTSNGG